MSAQNNQVSSCVTKMPTVPMSLEVMIVNAIQDIMELGSRAQVNSIIENIDVWSLMFSLLDIDECLTNTHSCDDPQRAICTNNNGSFSCQCKPGYTGSGFKNDCGIIIIIIDPAYYH